MISEGLARAKINLTLHVTGQREDGFHLLDSLVSFADFGDHITLTQADRMSLEVFGAFSTGVPADSRNLVWRAAELSGWTGHIALQKNLPHAAGIGSGSSDAATVLRLLKQQGLKIRTDKVLNLGADIPVCMAAKSTRMTGIGEHLEFVETPPLPAVLVNPGLQVPTGQVFANLASKQNSPMPARVPGFSDVSDYVSWLAEQRNDLEGPASDQATEIDRVLDTLRETGNALLARMSGSGATCFALYPTMKAAHFAAYEIGAAHSDWWIMATELS